MKDLNWHEMSERPTEAMAVLLFYGKMVWTYATGEPAVFPPYREAAERMELAYFDGEGFCFAGTGHDVFEDRVSTDEMFFPTHWAALLTGPIPAWSPSKNHTPIVRETQIKSVA